MTELDLNKLDRLAAEKIMGWSWDGRSDPPRILPGYWVHPDEDEKIFDWEPTYNIAHAWQLVEKLSSETIKVITKFRYPYDKKTYICLISDSILHSQVTCEAETAPLAIVKACLLAKGVKLD